MAGRRGSALSFNGTTNYVQAADASSLKNFSELTLITRFTMYALVGAGSAFAFISKMQWQNYLLFIDDGQRLKGTVTADSQQDCLGTSVLSVGVEHVGCLTYDGANMKLYLDGNLEKTTALTGAVATSTSPLQIGRIGDVWNTWYLNGTVGEVRIYNRALNAAEVKRRAESELMLVRH